MNDRMHENGKPNGLSKSDKGVIFCFLLTVVCIAVVVGTSDYREVRREPEQTDVDRQVRLVREQEERQRQEQMARTQAEIERDRRAIEQSP